ncbi:MAG: acyl-[Muribaculaceae bacterium]|nr:acyl-[acyl-carrier-protein] thioesterase [Muribaculaceae bacterium]
MKEFSKTYYLSAGECNPEREMPLSLLVARVIDVATLHANSWGVGYARLIEDNQAWVLSRITVEMSRYPKVNEDYTFTTWIEDYNRHFSLRNMCMTSPEGEVLGYVRTVWMVIDLTTRTGMDISKLSYINENVSDRVCPIEPQGRLRPVEGGETTTHTFGYADCDFNRHVNTLKYIELLMNQFDLSYFDKNMVHRMELAFVKETCYGECVDVCRLEEAPLDWRMSITNQEGDHVRARLVFVPRDNG